MKIGGSLLKYPVELSRLCNRLADLSGELDLLLVPGGGVFADVIRDVYTRFKLPENIAHQMAILSMDQYGILIQSLSQVSSQIIENIDDSKKCFEEHKIAILQVSNIMKSENRLPKSWSVTSDSIAAWMAQLIDAKRLLLIKSTVNSASSSPLSSCKKCPAPTIVVCAWPFVPGISLWKYASPPLVIRSESLKAVKKGLSHFFNTSQALRLGLEAGSSGLIGTSIGKRRAPAFRGGPAG